MKSKKNLLLFIGLHLLPLSFNYYIINLNILIMTYFRCVYLRNLKTSILFKGIIGVHVIGQIYGNKCNSVKYYIQ